MGSTKNELLVEIDDYGILLEQFQSILQLQTYLEITAFSLAGAVRSPSGSGIWNH